MSLESGKTLGGVGAILIAVGSLFPPLSLVGIILVLIAMKRLSEYYNERGIFDNTLWGFIFGLIGIAGAIAIFVLLFFTGFIWTSTTTPRALTIIGGIIAAIIVSFVFSLLQAIYYRKSFNALAEKTGEKTFNTAGLLLLIGAILTIILVGWLILLIAWILAAVGFLSIKTPTQPPAPSPAPPPATAASPLEKIYCRYCGTKTESDAAFCTKCGKQIGKE